MLTFEGVAYAIYDYPEMLEDMVETACQLVEDFLAEKIPQIRPVPLEATYLQWLDCSGLGMSGEELDRFMQEDAYWFTDPGSMFGPAGAQFQRINLACPTGVLQAALDRLDAAVLRRKG